MLHNFARDGCNNASGSSHNVLASANVSMDGGGVGWDVIQGFSSCHAYTQILRGAQLDAMATKNSISGCSVI